MGLSVVHGIVKKYNGQIFVKSKMGVGTTFTIYFPIRKNKISKKGKEVTDLFTGAEHILFIDDEISIAKFGKRFLEEMGYIVKAVTSSIKALEIFQNYPKEFDLVITDMTMPEMMGDKLAKKIKLIRPDIPIIMCTGYHKKVANKEVTEIGVDAIVSKPLQLETLSKTIRKVMDKVS